MFSYRHAFHAGNHADVLKHTALLVVLRHLVEKDTPLTVVDTHAGAGLYRLDGDYARTSAEAADGILRLATATVSAAALQDYLELVRGFNSGAALRVYPGSPFIAQRVLRASDKLKLFELHPTDAKALVANVAQLRMPRQVAAAREDGLAGARRFLPPPSRRGLVLCDPSYEIKSDYAKVADFLAECLKRFATGTYFVWHPIIARPEAHELPRRLRTLAQRAGKAWLHATLTVKSAKVVTSRAAAPVHAGLPASGIFVVNPPFTLRAALEPALPELASLLAQDRNASFTLESGG